MATLDDIENLVASHELELTGMLDTAFQELLEGIDANQVASSLDDNDADHIREQLSIILNLGDDGVPDAFATNAKEAGDLLESFILAIAALAAAQALHTINDRDPMLVSARNAARRFGQQVIADTAFQISAAIEAAIYSPDANHLRAGQLKRTIGLSVRQADSLETLRVALQRHLDTPRRLIPAKTDANGVRIPSRYGRQSNTRAILASTRGRISATQRQLLAKALANADLTQAEADRLLDRHAIALRKFRLKAIAAENVHELAEVGKVAGWQVAQRFGSLPTDQRRVWKTAGDERVRHTHDQVAALNPNGVRLDQPFATPFGPRMNAPLEWGCRCKSVLAVQR
jgi:hypothetical protein